MTLQQQTRHFLFVFLIHYLVLLAIWAMLPTSVRTSRSNDFRHRNRPLVLNFLNGSGFRESNGEVMTRFPPGHPIFLITVFAVAERAGISEETAIGLTTLGCQALSGALIFLLAAQVWPRRASFAVSLFVLTYVPAFHLSIKANNEVSYTPVFLLTILIFWHALKTERVYLFFVTGLLIGAGMLIRPFMIALPIVVAGLTLSSLLKSTFSKKMLFVSVLLFGNLLAIVPWQIWTYKHTSKFYLISSVGIYGIMDGMTYGLPKPERVTLDIPPGVLKLQQSAFDNFQNDNIHGVGSFVSWGFQYAARQPLDMASMLSRKALRTWYATDSHRWEGRLLFLQMPYIATFCAGLFVCLRRDGDVRRMAILALVLVLFYWAMTMAGLSIMRYIVPVMPIMLLMAAPICEAVLQRLTRSELGPES